MTKSVLISIHPKWTELILEGSKTIEVRKTCPSIGTPFKVYIYHTLPKSGDWNDKAGRVVAEFTCDYIERYVRVGTSGSLRTYYRKVEPGTFLAKDIDYKAMCLTPNEFADYGNGKILYGWHISGLKIYDKPKALIEFKRWNRTENNSPCAHTKFLYEPCESCKECNLTRPFQSWGYVEELTDADQ